MGDSFLRGRAVVDQLNGKCMVIGGGTPFAAVGFFCLFNALMLLLITARSIYDLSEVSILILSLSSQSFIDTSFTISCAGTGSLRYLQAIRKNRYNVLCSNAQMQAHPFAGYGSRLMLPPVSLANRNIGISQRDILQDITNF